MNEKYPLRGYLICEGCKLKLSSGTSRGNKSVDYYTYNKKCECKGKYGIDAKKLHPQFEAILESISLEEGFINFLRILLDEECDMRHKEKSTKKNLIKKDIRKLEEKMNKYIDTITSTNSKVTQKKIEEKIEETELLINQLKISLENNEKKDILKKVIDISFEIMKKPLYFWQNGSIDEKRLLLNLLFRNKLSVIREKEKFGTIPISPLFQLNQLFLDTKLQHLDITLSNSNTYYGELVKLSTLRAYYNRMTVGA